MTFPAEERSLRRAGRILRVGLGLVLLLWLLRAVNVQEAAGLMLGIRPALLALSWLCLLASTAATGLAWHASFPPLAAAPSRNDALRRTLVSFSINNVVPSGVGGDLYLIWITARERVSSALACYTVLLVHGCALVVLLPAVVLACAWLGAPLLAGLPVTPLRLAEWLLVVTLVSLVGWRLFLAFRRALPQRLQAKLQALGCGAQDVWLLALADLRRPLRLFPTLALSLAALALECVSVWFAAAALGAPGDPWCFMAMAPIARVLHRIPLFPNGVGPQEVVAVTAWGMAGLSPELSLSVSLLLHAVRLGVALMGALVYFASPGLRRVPGPFPVGS